MTASSEFPNTSQPRQFATTRWSLILAAGNSNQDGDSRKALTQLCEMYWYPLYAYLRRRGCSAHDSQDLIQAFFARLLEKRALAAADQPRGKFRSFLLTALKNFVANQRREGRRIKRGGGNAVLSLEFEAGESRYQREPADQRTPEDVFERRWALTLLEQSLERLRDEYIEAGKEKLFESLKDRLGGGDTPYKQLAESVGMTEGSVKVAVHRLRARYREILREEIAQTVATPIEVDEELREMFAVLGR